MYRTDKHILITGLNSYIGRSFQEYICNFSIESNNIRLSTETISVRCEEWRKKDFSKYDVILHVAAIVHNKEKPRLETIYKKVNTDLTLELAEKAKLEGVKQFIYISSMSVYGKRSGIIDRDTVPEPDTNYGKSKLKAEEGLIEMEDESFRIAIVRPPMVYGKGCKGNYARLSKIANVCTCFPYVKNQRSMIYIDNLCEFLKLVIIEDMDGLFHPQNEEYVCTSDMFSLIAKSKGKNVHLFHCITTLILSLRKRSSLIDKVFGDLIYDKDMSIISEKSYCVEGFTNSILKAEGKL